MVMVMLDSIKSSIDHFVDDLAIFVENRLPTTRTQITQDQQVIRRLCTDNRVRPTEYIRYYQDQVSTRYSTSKNGKQ